MVRLGFPEQANDGWIFLRCETEQGLAVSEKVKVGCVIEGVKPASRGSIREYDIEYFGGANIELSKTYVYHAEMIALIDCIMCRYYPRKLFVTSQSKEEDVFLCGDCRQQLLEINADCEVIVFNPDGTRKGSMLVKDLLPKHKDVEEKNEKYWKLTVS